jgi:hypothetical protein
MVSTPIGGQATLGENTAKLKVVPRELKANLAPLTLIFPYPHTRKGVVSPKENHVIEHAIDERDIRCNACCGESKNIL